MISLKYQKITCHIEKKDEMVLTDYFFTLGCVGTEIIEKNSDNSNYLGEIYTLDENDYPEEGIILIGYFPSDEVMPQIAQFINEQKIVLLDKMESTEIFSENYTDMYHTYFNEIVVNDNLSIVPSWFENQDINKTYIKIEPGLGFGTGRHASTQLAIKGFIKYHQDIDSLLDFGTGSGILAIIAKKYGVKKVYGIDLDQSALKNATNNASLNNVDVKFSCESIETFPHRVKMILANILTDILISNLADIYDHLQTNGILILSGILAEEQETMIKALQKFKLNILDIIEQNKWISITVQKY